MSSERVELDIGGILRRLPHRWPFVMVDRVTKLAAHEIIAGHKCVSMNEPWVVGHFPERPVMPAVLVIEALAQIGGILVHSSEPFDADRNHLFVLGVDKAKFRRPVVPGDRLELEVRVLQHRASTWKLAGRATVDGSPCAEAELLASVVPKEGSS